MRNLKLDFIKGIACILVVLAHIKLPGMIGEIFFNMAHFAVPIFYMVAGYYAFGKDEKTIKRRLKKIAIIFAISLVAYFVFFFALAVIGGETSAWLEKNINCMALVELIVFCTPSYIHPLWYLVGMIEVYILWLFVTKKHAEDKLLKLMPILFIVRCVYLTWCETIGTDFYLKINFLTMSLPWFLLGYYIYKNKETLNTTNAQKILLVIVGGTICLLPVVIDLKIKFNDVGTIPLAFGLFLLALNSPERSIGKPIEYIGLKLSLYVYLTHMMVGKTVAIIIQKILHLEMTGLVAWVYPIVTLLVTIVVSFVLYLLIDKKTLCRKKTDLKY